MDDSNGSSSCSVPIMVFILIAIFALYVFLNQNPTTYNYITGGG